MQPDPASNLAGVSHSSAESGIDHWISKLIPLRQLNFTCILVLVWGECLSVFTSERHLNLIQKHGERRICPSFGRLFQRLASHVIGLF